MASFVAKRILSGLFTVFFLATFTFFAMHAVPGDPLMNNKAVSAEIRANLKARYGLDKPVLTQYGIYMNNMIHGDFGISFAQQNRSVNDIIRESFPVSAELGLFALIVATLGGLILGAVAAIFRGKWLDSAIMFGVILCISVPNFVSAAVGQYLVTEINKFTGMDILPVAGWGSFKQMLLPSLVLGLGTLAFLTRLMRSSMLEIVNLDYIKTAKSKGLSSIRIFWSHQLRNASMPVISFIGPSIAAITTGGFVTETVFSIPGMGRYFVQAVQQLDYTVIMGLTVFYGAFLILMIIAVDILYGFVDPRIKLSGKRA